MYILRVRPFSFILMPSTDPTGAKLFFWCLLIRKISFPFLFDQVILTKFYRRKKYDNALSISVYKCFFIRRPKHIYFESHLVEQNKKVVV